MSTVSDLAGPRPRSVLSGRTGLLPRQDIRDLVRRGFLRAAEDIAEAQYQPASLYVRLVEYRSAMQRTVPAAAGSPVGSE